MGSKTSFHHKLRLLFLLISTHGAHSICETHEKNSESMYQKIAKYSEFHMSQNIQSSFSTKQAEKVLLMSNAATTNRIRNQSSKIHEKQKKSDEIRETYLRKLQKRVPKKGAINHPNRDGNKGSNRTANKGEGERVPKKVNLAKKAPKRLSESKGKALPENKTKGQGDDPNKQDRVKKNPRNPVTQDITALPEFNNLGNTASQAPTIILAPSLSPSAKSFKKEDATIGQIIANENIPNAEQNNEMISHQDNNEIDFLEQIMISEEIVKKPFPIESENEPSSQLTTMPSVISSHPPSFYPSSKPSIYPSHSPNFHPTSVPSIYPSHSPNFHPTSVPSIYPSRPPSYYPSTKPSITPSLSPSRNPSTQISSIPSQSLSQNPTVPPSIHSENFESGHVQSHEIQIPAFTIYLSVVTGAKLDKDLLVKLTAEHMTLVFAQDVHFHGLDLSITQPGRDRNRDRDRRLQINSLSSESIVFVFHGSARFTDQNSIPNDLRELIDRSFDDYFLNIYMGSLRSSGIDAMSIHVENASFNSLQKETTVVVNEKRSLNKAALSISFVTVVCMTVFMSYMFYQREVAGIDHKFRDDDSFDDRINFEVQIVKSERSLCTANRSNVHRKYRKEDLSGIFQPSNDRYEREYNYDDCRDMDSYNSAISSLGRDISIVTSESFDWPHNHKIS